MDLPLQMPLGAALNNKSVDRLRCKLKVSLSMVKMRWRCPMVEKKETVG
jgi:hypothetical protein